MLTAVCRKHNLIRSLRAVLLGLIAAAVVVTGCGPAPAASPTPAATISPSPNPSETRALPSSTATSSVPGTVTIWVEWNQAELRTLERLISEYRDLHPGARFEIVYHQSGELRPAFEAALEDGPVPSLLIGPSDWGDPLHEAGALRDLTGSVLDEQRETIHPLAWSQVDRGEVILGLPLELKGTLLYRNSSWALEPPATVADMVEAGQAARRAGAVGAALDLSFPQSAPMIRTCRDRFTLETGTDPVSRPAGLCWLRMLDRIGDAGEVVFSSDEDLQAFREGRAAWLLESSGQLAELRDDIGADRLAVDGWPRYEPTGERLAGYTWTENMYFPRAASDQDFEAAFAFAVFLLAAENQRTLAQASGVNHIPGLRDVTLKDPLLSAAREILVVGVERPDMRAYTRLAAELNTAARLVVTQGGDPELALELALEEIRLALAPTATPTPTVSPTLSPTPSQTPFPTPPPG
ncbi:MAG: extracellular solute-binding protein [Anaerolineales bacterium]|nr:extracellular solute-binding protein [Anaerolineales bacterium]